MSSNCNNINNKVYKRDKRFTQKCKSLRDQGAPSCLAPQQWLAEVVQNNLWVWAMPLLELQKLTPSWPEPGHV